MIRICLVALACALLWCVAQAQIGPGPIMSPISATQAAVSRMFGSGANTGTSGQTAWTSSTLTFPTPATNRYLVAAIGFSSAGTPGAVSIGGVSATQTAQIHNGATSTGAYVYTAAVPSGSSGTVVVTWDGANQFTASAEVYALFFNHSITPSSTSTASGTSASITVLDNSVTIAVAINGGSAAQSWTNLTSDDAQAWGTLRASSASAAIAASSSRTVTATNATALAIATWGQ